MSDLLDAVLTPLYYADSALLLAWRRIFELLSSDDGWPWALAIVGTAATIRVLTMPFYLGQMRARRAIQKLEPEIRALKETYADDPERLAEEQMRLLRAAGANPFLSCLPMVLLGALLVALFRIIDTSAKYAPGDGEFRRGLITGTEAESLARAKVLGARIAESFVNASHPQAQVLAGVLVAIVCVMHLVAQRQDAAQVVTTPGAVSGPVEQRRTVLLPALVVGIAAVSLVLPVGVLIFWATSKVWTVGQQRLLRGYPDPDPAT